MCTQNMGSTGTLVREHLLPVASCQGYILRWIRVSLCVLCEIAVFSLSSRGICGPPDVLGLLPFPPTALLELL